MKETLGADQQVTTADIARDDPMAEAGPKDGPAPRDSKTESSARRHSLARHNMSHPSRLRWRSHCR